MVAWLILSHLACLAAGAVLAPALKRLIDK